MNDNANAPRPDPATGWNGMNWDKGNAPGGAGPGPGGQRLEGARAPAASDNALTRFLGGSPTAVVTRLLIMSVVVGAVLIWLDIRPYEIFATLDRFAQRIWLMGFDAVREIATYVVAGAVIVVPIWLILRLMNMRGR